MDEKKMNSPEEEAEVKAAEEAEETPAEPEAAASAEPEAAVKEPEEKKEPAKESAEEKKPKKKKPHDAEELEKVKKQLAEQQDRYLRLVAEYDNYRKRTQKEREGIYPEAVANTIKELLPLFDNFQRALDTPCADESYAKGIEMIEKSLEEFLKKMGVEAFGKAGETFDPNLHNAVMHVDDESLGKNVIAQVFQSGYRIGDRILRHAMVQQAN